MQYQAAWPWGLTLLLVGAGVSISNACYLPVISFCTGLTYRPRKVAPQLPVPTVRAAGAGAHDDLPYHFRECFSVKLHSP